MAGGASEAVNDGGQLVTSVAASSANITSPVSAMMSSHFAIPVAPPELGMTSVVTVPIHTETIASPVVAPFFSELQTPPAMMSSPVASQIVMSSVVTVPVCSDKTSPAVAASSFSQRLINSSLVAVAPFVSSKLDITSPRCCFDATGGDDTISLCHDVVTSPEVEDDEAFSGFEQRELSAQQQRHPREFTNSASISLDEDDDYVEGMNDAEGLNDVEGMNDVDGMNDVKGYALDSASPVSAVPETGMFYPQLVRGDVKSLNQERHIQLPSSDAGILSKPNDVIAAHSSQPLALGDAIPIADDVRSAADDVIRDDVVSKAASSWDGDAIKRLSEERLVAVAGVTTVQAGNLITEHVSKVTAANDVISIGTDDVISDSVRKAASTNVDLTPRVSEGVAVKTDNMMTGNVVILSSTSSDVICTESDDGICDIVSTWTSTGDVELTPKSSNEPTSNDGAPAPSSCSTEADAVIVELSSEPTPATDPSVLAKCDDVFSLAANSEVSASVSTEVSAASTSNAATIPAPNEVTPAPASNDVVSASNDVVSVVSRSDNILSIACNDVIPACSFIDANSTNESNIIPVTTSKYAIASSSDDVGCTITSASASTDAISSTLKCSDVISAPVSCGVVPVSGANDVFVVSLSNDVIPAAKSNNTISAIASNDGISVSNLNDLMPAIIPTGYIYASRSTNNVSSAVHTSDDVTLISGVTRPTFPQVPQEQQQTTAQAGYSVPGGATRVSSDVLVDDVATVTSASEVDALPSRVIRSSELQNLEIAEETLIIFSELVQQYESDPAVVAGLSRLHAELIRCDDASEFIAFLDRISP